MQICINNAYQLRGNYILQIYSVLGWMKIWVRFPVICVYLFQTDFPVDKCCTTIWIKMRYHYICTYEPILCMYFVYIIVSEYVFYDIKRNHLAQVLAYSALIRIFFYVYFYVMHTFLNNIGFSDQFRKNMKDLR